MRTVTIGADEVSVQGSPWALFLYNREFEANWHDDYEQAYSHAKYIDGDATPAALGEFVASLDSMFLLKTLWACLSSTNAKTPPFSKWAKNAQVSMAPVAAWKLEVHTLINAELFRYGADEVDNAE